MNCTVDSDCSSGPQTTTCSDLDGFCTCPTMNPVLVQPIHNPIIKYDNLAASEHNESAMLVEDGLIDEIETW